MDGRRNIPREVDGRNPDSIRDWAAKAADLIDRPLRSVRMTFEAESLYLVDARRVTGQIRDHNRVDRAEEWLVAFYLSTNVAGTPVPAFVYTMTTGTLIATVPATNAGSLLLIRTDTAGVFAVNCQFLPGAIDVYPNAIALGMVDQAPVLSFLL